MKNEDWVILWLLTAVMILALLSFARVPAYEKAIEHISDALSGSLLTVIGYKFGRSMPQQANDPKPGQQQTSTQQATTETKNTTEPK